MPLEPVRCHPHIAAMSETATSASRIDGRHLHERGAVGISRRAPGAVCPLSHRRLPELRVSGTGKPWPRFVSAMKSCRSKRSSPTSGSSHEEDRENSYGAVRSGGIDRENGGPKLLDVRTREEFEAVKLPDAELFSNELMNEVFGTWEKETLIVVYDHTGDRSLDAAAYLLGHGYKNTRALRGGIDAYASEVGSGFGALPG